MLALEEADLAVWEDTRLEFSLDIEDDDIDDPRGLFDGLRLGGAVADDVGSRLEPATITALDQYETAEQLNHVLRDVIETLIPVDRKDCRQPRIF
jgi:hypothetical protein